MDGNSAIANCGRLLFACCLGMALVMPAQLSGQENTAGPAGAGDHDAPAIRRADPFGDLYPDADLPAADGATAQPQTPTTPDDSAVTPSEGEAPPSPDLARPAAEDEETAEETGPSSREFSDLYPDVTLPGAGSPQINSSTGGSGAAELPDTTSPPANPRDAAQDSFEDLYPDVPLPGEGEPEETEPPGNDDTTLIEELLSDPKLPPWEGIDPQDAAQRSPRELLALFDPVVDESQLRSLIDGEPLVPAEEEILTRLLYRLPRFALDQIDTWEKKGANWDDLVKEPGFCRMEFFPVQGRAQGITRIKVIPEVAERLGFGHYYRVAFDMANAPFRAVVCTRNIPNAWIRGQKEGQQLDERAGFSGLFVKVGGQREGATELVFATRRIAWYPDHLNPELGVTKSKVLLGDLGMDVGLLEFVKDASSPPIVQSDREPFYQMLAAVGRTTRDKLERSAATTHDIGKMLLDPGSQRGQLISLRGNARRVTRIAVDDPDIRQRFGISHYYEIAVFVPLDRRIEIPVGDDEPPRRFDNDYPMIFCVRELPEGMPRGPDIRESVLVQIPAFYFKLYAYKSQYMSSADRSRRQLSPLLIGLEPQWIDADRQTNPLFSIMLGTLFIVAMAGIWFGLWRYSRSDRQFERSTLSRQFELSEGKSLNEMGIEASSGPDFSGLEAADKASDQRPDSNAAGEQN